MGPALHEEGGSRSKSLNSYTQPLEQRAHHHSIPFEFDEGKTFSMDVLTRCRRDRAVGMGVCRGVRLPLVTYQKGLEERMVPYPGDSVYLNCVKRSEANHAPNIKRGILSFIPTHTSSIRWPQGLLGGVLASVFPGRALVPGQVRLVEASNIRHQRVIYPILVQLSQI